METNYHVTIGKDGEFYYQCLKCGSVGNWGERIITKECHEPRESSQQMDEETKRN